MTRRYELIGIPENADWIQERIHAFRGNLVSPVRNGPRFPLVHPTRPVKGLLGRDWYLFRTSSWEDPVFFGWVPREHWDQCATTGYLGHRSPERRDLCVQADLRRIPQFRTVVSQIELGVLLSQHGIYLYRLEDSPVLNPPRVSGRKPLVEMELTG